MQQFTYNRKQATFGMVMMHMPDPSALCAALWLRVRLVWLWLLYRHDHIDKEELWADQYCQRYFADPEIRDLWDAYVDCVCAGLAGLKAGFSADEATPPEMEEIGEKIKAAIRERLWREFPQLHRDRVRDRLRVWELGEERYAEAYYRMFWPFVW